MAKIFLTGGAGFVGKYLWRHLLSQGHNMTVVVRPGAIIPIEVDGTQIIRADFTLLSAPDALVGCDTVIHLAARAHVLKEAVENPPELFQRTNVDGVMNLIRLAAAADVRRFVFVSSIGVNGNSTRGIPFTENDVPHPVDLYAISKLTAENQLMTFAQTHGIELVVVRPTLVFGPDAPGNFGALLKLAATGFPLPFGAFKAGRSLISVWNLVDLLALCAVHPSAANQIFVAADGQRVTLPEILTLIRTGMKKPPKLLSIPPQLLHRVACVVGRGGIIAKLAAELLVDNTKSTKGLGWQPILTTAEGLQRTAREYLEMKREKNI